MGRKFGSEIGWALLEAVADGIEIVEISQRRPMALLQYGLTDLKTLDAERARRRVSSALRRLKRQKFIEEQHEGDQCALRLTQLGARSLGARQNMRPPSLPLGLSIVVSFDIPEKYTTARNAFRRYLRKLHFRQLHRSVWVSDLDWSSTLQAHVTDSKMTEWVKFFKADCHFP